LLPLAIVTLPCPDRRPPNKDHAKPVVRFAHQILTIANQLTEQLEAGLGLGTSDLGRQVELHSGPATARVLRGTKSRFQVFWGYHEYRQSHQKDWRSWEDPSFRNQSRIDSRSRQAALVDKMRWHNHGQGKKGNDRYALCPLH
jgi:hypothetical protein